LLGGGAPGRGPGFVFESTSGYADRYDPEFTERGKLKGSVVNGGTWTEPDIPIEKQCELTT